MAKKVIVIGAGVSGLAAAARAARMGYDVQVLEKQAVSGGRMGLVEKDGFKFDLGPTIVMMPQIYREVFEFCGEDPDDYIPMEKLDPIYKVYFPDGEVHTASSELSKLVGEVEGIGFSEAEGYLRYLSDVYQRYLVAKDHFIMRAFRKPSDFYNPKTLLAALKLRTFDDAYSSIGKFVKNERLRELLSFQTLYIGVSPFHGPSIYTIIPMIELVYGVWFIKGGMRAMSDGMERLLRKLGGKVSFNTPVEKIVIEGGRTKGVISGGKLLEADYVINSPDFPYAMDNLLPKGFRQAKYVAGESSSLEYSCSCYMLYIGLDKADFPGLEVHNLAFSSDFSGNIEDIFKGDFPADPSIYCYAPALKDPSLAPEGKLGLYVLAPLANLKDGKDSWKDASFREKARKEVMDRIETIAPLKGYRDHIEFVEEIDPEGFKERFNAMYGATFGLKPTLLQSNYFRPQPKAQNCKGLYFTGSSCHPGAGVPIVLTSAKLVVEELAIDDKNGG